MAKEKEARIRPHGEYVLVQRLKKETVSPGGIVIPGEAQEKANLGKVLAVGPGRITEHGIRLEPQVKKGDLVLLPKYAGAEDMGKALPSEHLIIRESEILGVVEEE